MAKTWIELGRSERRRRIALPPKMRSTHMHVIGASGRGKSKFLEGMLRRDIMNREGLCLIDPHGYLYNDILRWCETRGLLGKRVIYLFEPAADGHAFGFNPLAFGTSDADEVSFSVDAMVQATAQVWGGEDTSRTPLLKRCLRSIFHALAEHQLTLLEAMDLSSAEDYDGLRRFLSAKISDPVIAKQWQEFNAMSGVEFREVFSSTNNRLMEFLAAAVIRQTIGQRDRTIDLASAMDEGAIILVNLASGGKLSDDNARLLGSLLVNDLFLKARRRPPKSRPFYLYIDECSLFVSDDIARILDEGRKFGLHLILAHQHLAQLKRASEVIYSSVMTNAQTKVVFGGLTPDDARVLTETLFVGEFDLEEEKVRYNKPVVTGYVKTWLQNEGSTTSASESSSAGSSTGTANHWRDGEEISETLSESESWSRSHSESYSQSEGMSEALVPILEELPSIPYSLEEQIYRAMATMINQPTRKAIVKLPGRRPRQVLTPHIHDAVARDERVERFKLRSYEGTSFARLCGEADREIEERRSGLVEAARAYRNRREPRDFLE